MPVETFTDGIEPEDPNAVIWRFMEVWKFEDLMRGQLYFRRADLFDDETEGLPPKEYEHVLGLNPYDLNDIYERDHHIAFIAQFRESYYINCWYLFEDETVAMWKQYGQNGVAICSRYTLLKEVLDPITDRPHLGLVRYGSKHLTGWNTMRFITTKKEKYAHEKEVRALLWITDEHASGNRHFDENNKPHPRPLTPPPAHVLEDVKRKVDVQKLVTAVVVSPYADPTTLGQVEQAVRDGGYSIPVKPSDLTRFGRFLL